MNIKRLLAVATALLLISLMPLITKAQWTSQTSGTINRLNSVFFTDIDTGFAVGGLYYNDVHGLWNFSNVIIKTTDGGTNWAVINNEWNYGTWDIILNSVFFINSRTGWTVGNRENGTSYAGIKKTIDGGDNWVNQFSGTANPLYSIQFIDTNTGYTSGANGTIMKTINGGTNWTPLTTNTTVNLNSICFIDAVVGFCAGDFDGSNGVILKTTDGGTTWTPQISNTTNSLKAIKFYNSNVGFAIGDNGVILKTINGGLNWIPQTSFTNQRLNSIAIITQDTAYISGVNGTILKTYDGGNHWIPETSVNSFSINSIFFINSNIGWLVGDGPSGYYYDYTEGTIASTTNGGTKPPAVSTGSADLVNDDVIFNGTVHPNGLVTQVYFEYGLTPDYGITTPSDSFPAYRSGNYTALFGTPALFTTYHYRIKAVNSAGTAYGTDRSFVFLNGWEVQASGTTEHLNCVQFVNDSTGYIVGNNGAILKTTNYGANWIIKNSGTTDAFSSCFFANQSIGYASTFGGYLYKTTNGGDNWAMIKNFGYTIYDIYFTSTLAGIAVGSSGKIFRTTDGGSNWATIASGVTSSLMSVSFSRSSSNYGYIVGDNGKFFATSNNGLNWTSKTTGTTSNLFSVNTPFSNYYAFAVGAAGISKNTYSYGDFFNVGNSGTTQNLNSNYFINDSLGYAVGNNGTIIKSDNQAFNWQSVAANTTETLNSVFFPNIPEGWVVGNNGLILHTRTAGYSGVSITAQPSNETKCAGENITFSVSAVGQELKYQWYKGGLQISGAINSTCAINNIAQSDSGTYYCVVYNQYYTDTSNVAKLIVKNSPDAPVAANNGPVCVGSQLSLSASTISGATYSWTGPNGFTSNLQNPVVSSSATLDMTGTYNVTAVANGCSSSVVTTTVTIRSVTGSYNLTSPANGAFSSSTPNFIWGNSAGATFYQLFVDGVLKKDNIAIPSYNLQSGEALTPGIHTWYVMANGCTQSNSTWSIIVDTTKPTAFNLISPANNSWTSNLQPVFQWSSSVDVNSGLAKYQLWIDGSLNKDNILSPSAQPTNNLSNGNHTWMIKAIDNVGNVRNSSQTWTIKIDNLSPYGTSNYSLNTSGTNVYKEVQVPHSAYLNMTGQIITLEAWVKPYATQSNATVISKANGCCYDHPYSLNLENLKVNFRCYELYQGRSFTANSTIPTNTWTHIAVTCDGSTLRFYINGVQDATANVSSLNFVNNTEAVHIGYNSYYKNFNGEIDEVRIWNTCRAQSDILYYKDQNLCGNETGLMAYWRFNEGSGLTAYDKSGYGNNGTHNNSTYSLSNLPKFGDLCTFKSPAPNAYLQTQLPTFSWGRALDDGIGFQKFQLYIDGSLVKDNLSDSTWTITVPLNYGQHTWYVIGCDSLGNCQCALPKSFYIDNARPNAFNLLTPTDNSNVPLPVPNLTWQGTTDSTGGSGLRKYQLWINGVKNRDSISALSTTTTPTNPLAQGCYTWFIKAMDNVGNVRQSNQTWTFCVDWEPPIPFTLVSPVDNETVSVSRPSFIWHPSGDIGSGLQKYELIISGQSVVTVSPTDTSNTIVFDLENGSYTWYVKAYDNANAFTSSNVHNLIVDVPLPAQPATPAGPTSLCINSPNTTYTTAGGNYATSYVWNIYLGSAGVISGTGLSADVDWNNSFTGTAKIIVKGHSPVGDGPSSDTLFIDISPLSVGGSVSGSDTICAGSTTGVLQLTGYTGSITKWQKRLNSGTWTDIANTLSTYQEIPSQAGKWEYRAEVRSGGCTEIYSAAAVIVVSPLTLGGTASGNATICRGSSTPLMVVSGHTGSVIRWQKRLNSGTWTNINHNDSTYDEVPVSAGVWDYRANVQSGACSPENSTFATITVDSASVGGTVNGSASVCIGSSTGTLNLSGSYGTITKWQKRLNSGSWTDISNTSTSYSETPVQTGTWEYRAVVQNGVCAEANSGIATLIVFENTVAGSVGNNASICIGSTTGTLILTGYTGSITKWQKRLNSGSWTDISNTNSTYSETPLQAGSWEYRAWVKNGVCNADSSGIAMVVVDEPPVAGTVSPDTSFCEGSPTGLMVLNGNTGSVVKWQKRFNGGIWNDIANTNLTWSETPAQPGLWEYRAALVNGVCPMDYSAAAAVTVNDIPVVALGSDTTICGNMSISLNADNTGASYLWSDNSAGQSLLADTSGYGLGTHTFSVTVTHDGCIGFGSIDITFDACTGTFDNNESVFVLIYPNPVSYELIIEIEGNNETINFEIYNSIGQVVYKGNLTEKTVVQTKGFTPGVYLIKLDNNKSFEIRKIIKE